MFLKISLWFNFFRLNFPENEYTNFSNCIEKAGLNLHRYQKKYRPLGRWNIRLSMNNPLLILLLSNPVMQYKESLGLYCIWWGKYQKLIIHRKLKVLISVIFILKTYSKYPRRLPNFVKTQSCWRSKYWTPRRASRSGVAAPDAVMPWCVRVCQRTARPSPKRATSNRVFVIRADKEGGSQRVLRLRMHRTSAHRKRYSTRVRVYHSLRAPPCPGVSYRI